MQAEARVAALALEIPDFAATGYYGRDYGSMKPHHITGRLLFLSGHVAQRGGKVFSGRLGADLSVEAGYAAARLTGLNVLAGIRHAVGSLDRVSSIVRTLNFVVCAPDCTEVNRVSSGMTDLLRRGGRPRRSRHHRRDGAGRRRLLRDLGDGGTGGVAKCSPGARRKRCRHCGAGAAWRPIRAETSWPR